MLVALDRSLTAQRRLVADASHEFRTPLTSIRANAELLERGRVREDEQNAVARAVVEQVDELDGLVTDLIELALDGEAATRFEDVRLDEIVSVEVERMRRHAAGVQFELEAQPSTVQGDPERLGRAVANVLANAMKWSPPGGTVDVTVEPARWSCAITAPESTRPTCRSSSSASTARRPRAEWPAPASASRSCGTSSRRTAAASRRRTRPAAARSSRSASAA